jgi:hypothetical protein
MLKASPHNSRFILALCAFLGFAICLMASLGARTDASTALFRGAIGLACGAAMGKILLSVVYSSAKEVRDRKLQEQEEARRKREAEEALEDENEEE